MRAKVPAEAQVPACLATRILKVTPEEADLLCSKDARYRPLVEHFGLLSRELFQDCYAGLVMTIVGQQLSDQVVGKLRQSMDPAFFTSPEALIAACEHSLQVLSTVPPKTPRAELAAQHILPFSHNKIETLLRIARLFAEGSLSIAQLQNMDAAERERTLLSIKGVGPWSVSMIELMVFGERDYFAIHDYGVQQGWAYLTGADIKAMKPKERLAALQEHAQLVSPVGSAANLYLWALKGVHGKLPQ